MCDDYHHITQFNRRGEHILPKGFGNDGETDAVLKGKICTSWNKKFGDKIDMPFLRQINSREIARTRGMKRRHPENDAHVIGSGMIVRYKTSIAHLFECIKIAFETHIKFLGNDYRDNIFDVWHKILLEITIDDYTNKGQKTSIELQQFLMCQKYWNIIQNNIYNLDEIATNSVDIASKVKERSQVGSYASLIQLGCWSFGVAVMVYLQSLPPLVIRVSNEIDRYVKDYGHDGIHVMDLRTAEKWVGFESREPPPALPR